MTKSKLTNKFFKLAPFLVLILVTLFFFWKFFVKGLLPIPADIISGTYFPWFDIRFSQFPAGIPVKNTALSDVVSIMYPYRRLAIDLMKSGQMPLWNPYILSGNVLLANLQSAPFYPLNIFYWVINNFSTAWSVEVILQPFLGALFMYLFLRVSKLSKTSSLFGGIVWGFNGFFLVWLEYNTLVHACIYFPLILLALQKSIENKKYYLLLTLSVAFSSCAGYPQVTLYELFFAAVFLIFILPKFNIKKYLLSLIFVLLGIGLASPSLLPGYAISSQSIRQVDAVAISSHAKYIFPEQVVTFLAPDYFGNPATSNFWLNKSTYENAVIYTSVAAFLLFICIFFIKKKDLNYRLIKYSWLIFFASVVFAFKNPLSELLGNLNFLGTSASVMGRIAIIMTFGVALGSSIALEELLVHKVSIKELIIPFFISLSFIFVPGTISIVSKYRLPNCSWCAVSLRNLGLPSILFLISWLVLGVLTLVSNKKIKVTLAFILILMVVLDLFRFHNKYNSFSSSVLLYPQNSVINYLKSQGQVRIESEDGPILPPNMWMVDGLYSSSGQDAVHSIRYNKFINFINTGILTASNRYVKITNFSSQLIDFLGIKYIAAIKWKNGSSDFNGVASYRFSDKKFSVVFEKDRSLVIKNSGAYPLIFGVNSYVKAQKDEEFEKLLSSIDLSKTVILENNSIATPNATKVEISNFKINSSIISADVGTDGKTIVVLTETYFPDWKAYLDGSEVSIYRADYAFMAVPVTAGNHILVFKYEPRSFADGLTVGIISFIILLGFSAFFFIRENNS